VWLLLPIAGAQTEQSAPALEGRVIDEVLYSPAPPSLAPADLAIAQPVKPGQALRAEDIAAAIDGLYATGRFNDVRVEADTIPNGHVNVRFILDERWFVGHVGVRGKMSPPPNRGQVANAAQLNLGAPYDDASLPGAEERMRRVLENNGLYEAAISPQVVRDPEAHQVNFTFIVKAGKRARYLDPSITGDTKLSEKAIVRATGWKYRFIGRWKQVNDSRTRSGVTGIQSKYSSQDRLMAKVELKGLNYDHASRRLMPSLEIQSGPKVKIKAVEAKFSKKNLRKYVPVYEERRVDRDLLVEGARNLRDYFQTSGYYDVDVDFRQRPEANDEVAIEYVVSKGQRYKLEAVKVEGNRYFNAETIRERMFLEPAGFVRFRHGRYSEAFRKKDEENIENLYKSNGFRDCKVTSEVDRNAGGKAGQMTVTFKVDEGAQWIVDSLDIEGAASVPREELNAKLSSIPGQPYSEVNVASDRAAILTTYFSRGFPDAAFRWDTAPGAQPNHIRLSYTITEGRPQFVRDVLVSGVRNTRQTLVDKRLTVEPEQPLSLVAMTEGQKRLYDTGVMAKVSTAVQNPEGQTLRKYVLYDIEEAARYNVNVGFGAEFARLGGTANTLDTPAGGTGFSPRVSLDISRMNMFGLGHFATLRGRFSNLQTLGSISYVAPRFSDVEGRNVTFTALYDNSREVRTFESTRAEASIQLSQQFSRATTGLFRYTFRRVSTSNVVIPALLVPQLLQPVRIGLISANLAQDRRDDPVDSHRGIFNTFDLGVASRYLGSSRSFVRGLARNATYHRLTRNVILARETTFGAILPFSIPAGLERNESIPLPERFFGGGSTSHRGFPENQAGPRDIGIPAGPGGTATQPTGFPLGGNALLFNIVELRFPLIGDNIRGVFFHDAGNVYRSIGDISFRFSQRDNQDFNYMVHAVGFGLRYKTPIGPVRGDLSYSVNPPSFVGFKGTVQDLLQCDPSKPLSQLPGSCQGVPQRISHFQFFFSIGQTF
jgi:outer membrane protein assembly complex protein YaeT